MVGASQATAANGVEGRELAQLGGELIERELEDVLEDRRVGMERDLGAAR